MTGKVLRVGILGTGEAVENIYLPILLDSDQSSQYQVTAIYDARDATVQAFQRTYNIPTATTNVEAILRDPTIDLVIITLPTEYHEAHIVGSLDAGKHVLVDAPITLSLQSTRRILAAEGRAPNGARVFVSYARRYTPCFEEVFKREVAALDRIYYARCRNISGPGRLLRPWKTSGVAAVNGNGGASQLCQRLLQEVFLDQDLSEERVALCQFLASTGCHDLAMMRETLGYPDGVSCVTVNDPFYSAIFHYKKGGTDGEDHPFTLMYEAGTDAVSRCDAHLAVYGAKKTVTIHFDSPYVKGRPVRVLVQETGEDGQAKTTESLSSCEDAYRQEFRALYSFLVDGEAPKTTAGDAMKELKLFGMIFAQYDRQCGTIRTPLG